MEKELTMKEMAKRGGLATKRKMLKKDPDYFKKLGEKGGKKKKKGK